jgi:hypothetical protein
MYVTTTDQLQKENAEKEIIVAFGRILDKT